MKNDVKKQWFFCEQLFFFLIKKKENPKMWKKFVSFVRRRKEIRECYLFLKSTVKH